MHIGLKQDTDDNEHAQCFAPLNKPQHAYECYIGTFLCGVTMMTVAADNDRNVAVEQPHKGEMVGTRHTMMTLQKVGI